MRYLTGFGFEVWVTAALLGAVLGVLRDRGHRELVTEIDATNRAANALAARGGAVHTGDSYVLRSPG